ncbi:MAG: 16S rRNA (cytosine(1402)-N(4))-methyltransferase RsmH [Synergistaceae bacterium]|jgi:16S rRNA (cytosine1402-N4)-methyltransferase|nr:16S rRNA (cytosine(1402)-N(4))-methyltransferase RsmH [Synergistaceae bacterium]
MTVEAAMGAEHEPVLLTEVMELLRLNGMERSKKVVDCTLGLGGYSREILRAFPEAKVYGLDRDLSAIVRSRARLAEYAARFHALHKNFGGMGEVLTDFAPFDAFVFDLGVSNMQLTEADRGFSFQNDGPLDMRMNPDGAAETAAEVLQRLSAEELAKIFWRYGEERYARQIAAKIEETRKKGGSLKTTGELVTLIRDLLPAPVQRKMGTHPARRVFQALRIYVNEELEELEAGLASVKRFVSPGAIVIVVSYHSLEDRIVKHTFRTWETEEKIGIVLTKHPVLAEPREIEKNFKARSAKLRSFRFSAKSGGKTRGKRDKAK